MSLITRCTTCETLFRVVPDQLRISDGWVRCGQCGEVFDAAQNLLESLPQEQQILAAGPVIQTPDPSTNPLPGTPGTHDPLQNRQPAADAPAVQPPQTAGAAGLAAERQYEWPQRAAPDDVEDYDNLSFMQQRNSASGSHRPVLRAAMAVLLVLLATGLGLQVAYQERDRITALVPAARPALAALCALARCQLAPMRQIESIVIDGSTFERIRGDTYRFAVSLRNTAGIDIAMPSLELSITDAQDQALVRRVFQPADFAAGTTVLGGGAEWSTKLTMGVKTSSPGERISGYRVLAFYP